MIESMQQYEEITRIKGEKHCIAKFIIETGKKHQIRLNCMNALGTPIYGDIKYGFEGEGKLKENEIMLHSYEL